MVSKAYRTVLLLVGTGAGGMDRLEVEASKIQAHAGPVVPPLWADRAVLSYAGHLECIWCRKLTPVLHSSAGDALG